MTKKKEVSPIALILSSKAAFKQDLFSHSKERFKVLKKVLSDVIEKTKEELGDSNDKIRLKYEDRGQYEAKIWVGGDVLVFHMHTNVFQIPPTDNLWQTAYLRENPTFGYCGVINVYNFLADSFIYNRVNDSGFLIGRLLLNIEDHFMFQGKMRFRFDYQNFINNKLDEKMMRSLVEDLILQSISFEMYIPPYERVSVVSVNEMKKLSNNLKIKTSKRLGFKMNTDQDVKFSDIQ